MSESSRPAREGRHPTLAEIVEVVEELFPPSLAQSWDRVGLVTGEDDAPVRRMLLAVDPTLAVVDDAVAGSFDVVLTHHPLLLRGVSTIVPTTAKGAALTRLVRAGIGLYCAHTSADSAEPGVSHALADALGLRGTRPLAHPEGKPLGRVGVLAEPTTLEAFVVRVAEALPTAPGGIRWAGSPSRTVERVAVAGGAGDDELDAVRDSGADVYVTADLRHHPALEDLELSAASGGPALVDAGHFASEWPWLAVAAGQIREAVARRGATVDVVVSTRCTDPWSGVVLPDASRAPDPADLAAPAARSTTPTPRSQP